MYGGFRLYSHDQRYLANWRSNIVELARDHVSRTVQWDDSPDAGFCEIGYQALFSGQ